jgi:hypothetical protein
MVSDGIYEHQGAHPFHANGYGGPGCGRLFSSGGGVLMEKKKEIFEGGRRMKQWSVVFAVLLSLNPFVWAGDKESYVNKTETELRQWSAKVDRLQMRAEKAGSQTRAEIDGQLRMVRAKVNAGRRKLVRLQGSGEGTWQTLRRGADDTLRNVQRTYQRTVSLFKKDEKEKS